MIHFSFQLRHAGERKVRVQDEQFSSAITDALEKLNADDDEEVELEVEEEDSNLNSIDEENEGKTFK